MAEENQDQFIPQPFRCRFLTIKSMFYDTGRDPWESTGSNMWCAITQTCLGPDGRIADDRECTAARNCFDGI